MQRPCGVGLSRSWKGVPPAGEQIWESEGLPHRGQARPGAQDSAWICPQGMGTPAGRVPPAGSFKPLTIPSSLHTPSAILQGSRLLSLRQTLRQDRRAHSTPSPVWPWSPGCPGQLSLGTEHPGCAWCGGGDCQRSEILRMEPQVCRLERLLLRRRGPPTQPFPRCNPRERRSEVIPSWRKGRLPASVGPGSGQDALGAAEPLC